MLGKYLCLCFFSYEIIDAILTYLKSTAECGVVNTGAVAIKMNLRRDRKMFSVQNTSSIKKKSPSLWDCSPFLPSISSLNFSHVKALSPPYRSVLCKRKNNVCSQEIQSLKHFSFYVNKKKKKTNLNLLELSCP